MSLWRVLWFVHLAAAGVRAQEGGAASAPDKVGGCCFAIGYGAMMKPCCLRTWIVNDISECKSEARLGGATGFTQGPCPTSATEAALLLRGTSHVDETAVIAAPSAAKGTIKEVRRAPGVESSSCCFAVGFGAMMKPCCLETWPAAEAEAGGCSGAEPRLGGAAGFAPGGSCPGTAEEAATLLAQRSPHRAALPPAPLRVATASSGPWAGGPAAGWARAGLGLGAVAAAVLTLVGWNRRRRPPTANVGRGRLLAQPASEE